MVCTRKEKKKKKEAKNHAQLIELFGLVFRVVWNWNSNIKATEQWFMLLPSFFFISGIHKWHE